MQLQKISNTAELSIIGRALVSPMIRSSSDEQIEEALTNAIARAYQDSGQKASDHDGEYLISTMTEEVKMRHPNLRVEEIGIAIANGIRKEYGDYFGLNVISFSNFLKRYIESEQRIKAATEMNKKSLPEKIVPDPVELIKLENEIIVNAYSKFLESGHYDDLGNHIYKKLDERGLIPFNRDRKLKIFEKARKNLESKYNPKSAISLDEKRTLQRHFDILLSNTNDSSTMIATEAKKIALMTLFQELKETEIDINEFIIETEEKF